ncbi:MAG: serine protease AprX [Mycobacterium sp.]|nr:serine protease AprX [Mycobacterium sp.]
MAIEIPRALIEYILLGSGDSRRQLQDSPILGDVWVQYAEHPNAQADLLITSHKDTTANKLAAAIYEGVEQVAGRPEKTRPDDVDPDIAPLQTFVAAKLYFDELLQIVIPMTKWWYQPRTAEEIEQYRTADEDAVANGDADSPRKLNQTIDDVTSLLTRWSTSEPANTANGRTAVERFVALCALVFLAGENIPPALADEEPGSDTPTPTSTADEVQKQTAEAVQNLRQSSPSDISRAVFNVLQSMTSDSEAEPMVFQISLNRHATPAIARSVPTVKGDAAQRLFGIDCSELNWAIIDSGIDRNHPSLERGRFRGTFDFTNYRRIVTLGNNKPAVRKKNLAVLQESRGENMPDDDPDGMLAEIASSVVKGRSLRWDLVREFVEIKPKPGVDPPRPPSAHGTHVAGIIGATKHEEDPESADGMCPGIGLYDFRILSADADTTITDTEFAVIAALQFIRYINEQAGFLLINGVNLSVSIPHDVRNYACGGTPVCTESERLIDSGVVVVAAAGNLGYQHSVVGGQPFDNYAALSITDPGNAERVITVGSTHKSAPTTYGVSYFSSRGPTGDGRLKPDLVAPGERVDSTVLDGAWGALDGTSMAAPHVSGAAALLMGRYPELIGRPDRIKKILCDTATDLGRDRSFQGHGMLDVLRALQSQ